MADFLYLTDSANIASSGAGTTTAQLTPPDGKTIDDFQAGHISDDVNPIPAIDIAADKYTEIEFSVEVDEINSTNDEIEFRVTAGGVPLDSYPEEAIPKITVAGVSVAEGVFVSATRVTAAMSCKTGSGGGLLAQTENLSLAQLGKEGQQASIASIFNSLISVMSGKSGVTGSGISALSNHILDVAGKHGITGPLATDTSLSALLFGNNDGADPQAVFEGTLAGAAGILSAELFGNTGVHGPVAGQIIMAASIAGQLGAAGSYTIQLDGISSIIEGILGISGEISTTISAGADLAAKLGICGDLVAAMDDLGLQLIEITRSEKIYQIIISTTSGRVVFLAPKFGKVEISTII
jgi:hypothetical protein